MNKESVSQAQSPADAKPWPQETRELINQALAMCVEKFRFPPEARPFVRRAADLGNPFGQYLWGLVLHYDLADHVQAWDYFERSAALGYHDSIRHLALLLEGGHVPLKGASRNPDSNADQIRKAACKLYLKAAELDNYQAKYQYGICCLEGRGRARNYKEAFRWLQFAACQGHKPAQIRLAELCLNPRQGCHNPLEAYIWATISASDDVNELLRGLETTLTRAEIDAAQAEADRRARILDERGRLSQPDLEAYERPEKSPQKPVSIIVESSPKTSSPKLHRSGLDYSSWKVAKITDIKLTLYLRDANVTIKYINKQDTQPADKLFSKNSLRLLILAYDFTRKGHPSLKKAENTIASAANPHKNMADCIPNDRVVVYFNSDFRKLFGLSKKDRAFDWDGGKYNSHLVANIDLEVKP